MTSSAPHPRILVVDDHPDTAELLRRMLAAEGFDVRAVLGVDEALGVLEREPIDLVVTDHKMPGASGLDLVRHVRENLKDTVVLMVTGYPTVVGAVEAMKSGAEEYLAKPFTDEELLASVRNALEKLRLRRSDRVPINPASVTHGLIGDSSVMAAVRAAIERAAASYATVLLTGESGTGKELVARAIHYSSPRSSSPFVPVNCGGIPESLIESELFGHVKGAFTGATTSRAGFFQTAEGGTLFLDEISETSLAVQVKLLRVLQDKNVVMVGSTRPRNMDVRIIAATNKDLDAAVANERFRQDLYFRLNVLNIALPSLRDRGEDVLLLVNHSMSRLAAEMGREIPGLTDAARTALMSYDWPGNVRELENVVQRLLVMGDADTFDVADLPSPMRRALPRESAVRRTLAQVEAAHIRRVLEHTGGNKTLAAKLLGIDRKTLRKKVDDLAQDSG